MGRNMADQKRRHRAATSKAMVSVAAARQCPSCDRKMALKRVDNFDGEGHALYVCRWCGHEHAPSLRTMTEDQP